MLRNPPSHSDTSPACHPRLPIWPVFVTLRSDSAFVLSSMKNLQVRVGSKLPGVAVPVDTATNLVCATRSGQLSLTRGVTIKLTCTTALTGRYLTLHIM